MGYVFIEDLFYIPASNNSKKVKNLARNRNATIVIDEEKRESGIMLECVTKILRGKKAELLIEHMKNKKGWLTGEDAVIIQLNPLRKASWILN